MKEKNAIKKENKVLEFFIKTLNGMAHGLFATLIIGTIIGTIGTFFGYGAGNPFCDFMLKVLGNGTTAGGGLAYCLQALTGAGIGIGVAIALGLPSLKVICLAAVGEIAAFLSLSSSFAANPLAYIDTFAFKIGDPLTIYVVVISVALIMQYALKKKTPVDIILIPLFCVFVGGAIALGIRYPLVYVTYGVQWIITNATNVVPALMGIIIAVLMGMALTAPISSAAIAAMIFVAPTVAGVQLTWAEMLASETYRGLAIASGAACVGCCTQMVGFAVQSRKDNPIGMVISVGIGTSMLQFKNILRKPIIWLPTIIASAILGPIATCLVPFACGGSSAGMGTAGLVGLIGVFNSTGNTWETWVAMFVLCIAAPIALVLALDLLFRKLGWIKEGDLKI